MSDIWEEINKKRRKQEEYLAQKLASSLGVPYFSFQIIKPHPSALELLPKELAEKSKTIPFKLEGKKIILTTVDPYNDDFKSVVKDFENKGYKVVWGIISNSSFLEGLDEYQIIKLRKLKIERSLEINPEILKKFEEEITRKEMLQNFCQELLKDNPFFILDVIIAGALKFEASDIHFEPYEKEIKIRYRLDGILYDVLSIPIDIYDMIKNRLKIISGMLLNVTDKPQDGRFSVNYKGENIDFRVSLVPSIYNESFVIRILIFSKIIRGLEDLGLRKDDYKILLNVIFQPNGLILNTGPTGSGKTTTLYAILLKIKKPDIKIITIENPVEYKIEGITQVEIDERKKITFSDALKSFLRHDPDVILVGEIRDPETAKTAIQASLTGHLVLSTLHTNDSLGAIPRLISLKVDPKLIPSALRLIIAQRLVRKICPYCKEIYEPDEETKNKIKNELKEIPQRVDVSKINFQKITLAKGKGCSFCFNTGYKGRIGIFELLLVDERLEEIIYKNPSESEIKELVKDNFVSLRQDGLLKALTHLTTLEEVERITGIF
ncbi:MAG: hypothetical protein C4348_02765 [Patescibacteria group bacterium]